jgi:hypothetical protein
VPHTFLKLLHRLVLGAYHSSLPGCKSIVDREKAHDQSPVPFDPLESVAETVSLTAEGTENSCGHLHAAAAVHRL